jgi:DHA2 family multidrug resistance protein
LNRVSVTTAERSAPPPLAGLQLWGVALLLGLANFMVVLDATIANVAVPHIAGGLAVSPSQGTWVITSYGVAEAISVPLTGWLVQRFGTVKVFVIAMAGFGVFSFLCGLAPTFAVLVVFRVLQGLMGGPIIPSTQTLLLSAFPRERTAQAMGLWTTTTVVGPIAGPLLGGLFCDGLGWNWIFFINVPVALGVAIGVWAQLRSRESAVRRVPVDYVGLALMVIWVGSLQMMLDRGKELEWFASTTIVVLAIAAAIGFVAFLIWELTAENPIVDLRVFRHRGFVLGATITVLGFGSFFASSVLMALWMQTGLGFTATVAGMVIASNGGFSILAAPLSAQLSRRFDGRVIISLGVAGMAGVSFWRMHLSTDATPLYVAATYLVQGLTIPFFFMAGSMLTLTSVLPSEIAAAAGLTNFMRTSGAAFATSIMTTVWENVSQAKRSELAGRLHDPAGAMAAMNAHGMAPDQARAQLDHLVQLQAMALSTEQMMYGLTWLFLLALGIVWLIPTRRTEAMLG